MTVHTARAFASREHGLFVNGSVLEPAGSEMLSVEDPATEESLAAVPLATEADVDRAVDAARTAFESGEWSACPPDDKTRTLLRLADLIEAGRE